MSKKMYDIVPPKKVAKVVGSLEGAVLGGKKKRSKVVKEFKETVRPKKVEMAAIVRPAEQPKIVDTSVAQTKNYGPAPKTSELPSLAPSPHSATPEKKKKFALKEILIGGVVIVLLLAAYGVTKLPKADVEIWPKQDTLTLSEKVAADKSATAVNLANMVIPSRLVQESKDLSQQFPATGSASDDGKATGTIKVYNKTGSAFGLVKGTHFLSDSGKYFVTMARVSIPAGSKNTPGSISVQVQAQESGTDYNIGPSKFSAPKLQGTAYYYNIYGESTTAMTGGHTGTVKKVTDDDIKQAKDLVTKTALQNAKDALKSTLAANDILLDGAMENSVTDNGPDVKSGAIADAFNEKVSVKILALVFKKQDLEAFIKSDIAAKLPSTSTFLPDTLTDSYDVTALDTKNGKLSLSVNGSVKTYYSMDVNNLVEAFKTKTSDQIKAVLDQQYNGRVAELKINFWPFWVHSAPDNGKRITVHLNFK